MSKRAKRTRRKPRARTGAYTRKTGKRGYECAQPTDDTAKRDAREARRLAIIREIERLTGRPRADGKARTKLNSSLVIQRARIPDAFATRCTWAGCKHTIYADKPYCAEHLLQSGGLLSARQD